MFKKLMRRIFPFLYVSGKYPCFEIINKIDKWQLRDTNVTILVYTVAALGISSGGGGQSGCQ